MPALRVEIPQVQAAKREFRRFTEDEVKATIKAVLDAVGFLHDLGMVHREIAPTNVAESGRLRPGAAAS